MNQVLFISLVNAPEIIDQVKAIKDFRRHNRDCKVHYMTFDSHKLLEEFLNEAVDVIHYLDSGVIEPLCEKGRVSLAQLEVAQLISTDLQKTEFTKVINLSSYSLGGLIAGQFQTSRKEGVFFAQGLYQRSRNNWFNYLAQQSFRGYRGVVNYRKVLSKTLGAREMSPRTADFMGRDRKVVVSLLNTKNLEINRMREIRSLVEELRAVLGTYEIEVFASPDGLKLAQQVFDLRELRSGSLHDLAKLFSQARLVLGDSRIVQTIAEFTETPMVQISEVLDEVQSFTDITKCWDILSGSMLPLNVDLRKSFEEQVWIQFLDGIGIVPGQEINSPGLVYNFGSVHFSQLSPLAAEKSLELQQQRDCLNKIKDILAGTSQDSNKSFSKNEIGKISTILKVLGDSNVDQSGYFKGMVDLLMQRHRSVDHARSVLVEETKRIEQILCVKENLVRKIEALSQKGSRYAKGFEFVLESSLRADRENTKQYSQNPEIL